MSANKYTAAWYGPSNGRGANQFAVQDADTNQPLAWCDTLEQAKTCASRLDSHAALLEQNRKLREALTNLCGSFETVARDCEHWMHYRDARAALTKEDV